MDPTRFGATKSAPKDRESTHGQHSKPLSLVQKSALLNLGIVVTALPVLLSLAGDLRAVPPTLAVLAAISGLIWTATFATASFVSVSKIFEAQRIEVARRAHRDLGREFGVADEWMDGSI